MAYLLKITTYVPDNGHTDWKYRFFETKREAVVALMEKEREASRYFHNILADKVVYQIPPKGYGTYEMHITVTLHELRSGDWIDQRL